MRYIRVFLLSMVLWILLAHLSPTTAQNTTDDTLLAEIGRGAIRNVFWHPDGTKFYVQTTRSAIWVYDRATLTEIGHLETGNYSLLISPSGHWIQVYRTEDKRWDLFSSSDFTQAEVEAINFSPDGRFILVSDTDDAIRLVDSETFLSVTDTPFPTDNLIWSPDSAKFANRLQTGEIQLWAMDEHGDFVKKVSFGTTSDTRLEWSPDSKKLAHQLIDDGYTFNLQ